MKVEPRFKLDQNYKGLYRVTEVTATNRIAKLINAPDQEMMIVPLQWLSKCHQPFPQNVTPWTGHGKSRKCIETKSQIQQMTKLPKETVVQQVVRHQIQPKRPGVVERLQYLSDTGQTLQLHQRSNLVRGGSCKGRSCKDSLTWAGVRDHVVPRNLWPTVTRV